MSMSPSVREVLARRIAGEIILSGRPGAAMRKWRELFGVSQMRLSEKMVVSSSVISDYESGRRKNPGTRFVRRFVWALLKIDGERGGRFIREFARLTSSPSVAVVDLREFPVPVRVEYLCRAINGEVIAGRPVREVLGYTVVDARRALETLSGFEYAQLLGASTERVVVFTNIDGGFSPMIMVRLSSLKPRVVVFHGVRPDEFSVRLAEYDGVLLVYSGLESVESVVRVLRRLYRVALRVKLGKRVRPPPKISV